MVGLPFRSLVREGADFAGPKGALFAGKRTFPYWRSRGAEFVHRLDWGACCNGLHSEWLIQDGKVISANKLFITD
jgi:hypothetical protein